MRGHASSEGNVSATPDRAFTHAPATTQASIASIALAMRIVVGEANDLAYEWARFATIFALARQTFPEEP